MKKVLPPILILMFTLLLGNCSENEIIDDTLKQYTGHYSVVSYKSNTAIDINNNGILTNELVDQIPAFGFNDLEIRPHEYQTNKSKLISFTFPKTNITFDYDHNPEGFVTGFVKYGYGTFFKFENNSFLLEKKSYTENLYIDNVRSDKEVFITSDLEIIDKNHLKISISKEYYDFSSTSWKRLEIDVIYERFTIGE